MNKEAGQILRIKKDDTITARTGPREARLAYKAPTQLEMVLRGETNIRFQFHTMAVTKMSRSACLGKPRSIQT